MTRVCMFLEKVVKSYSSTFTVLLARIPRMLYFLKAPTLSEA